MVDLAERVATLEYAKLLADRRAIAQDNQKSEFKSVNGMGELKARISMSEYHAVKDRYADMYSGGNCWDDPEFIKAYLRDNEHARVKISRGTRGQELPKGTLYVPPSYAK